MAVEIEKKHIELVDDISREINKNSDMPLKNDIRGYERLLNAKNLSIEQKKKKLVTSLRKLMVNIFAAGLKSSNKNDYRRALNNNLLALIGIVTKLSRTNYYLDSVLLKELGIIKPVKIGATKDYSGKDLQKRPIYLTKIELVKIENAVCRLIEKIILIDNRLVRKYTKREEKVVEREELEIEGINKILAKESEILDHIEAKLPPPKKLRQKLLKKPYFSYWMLTTLGLLSAFENEYRKETIIFEKLKKNHGIRKKIEIKINDILKEKESLFKIKEKKIKSIKNISSMEREFKEAVHNFASASNL